MSDDSKLLESPSPNGNAYAVVEQDARVAYLYLCGDEESGLGFRLCWVRNLVSAPETLDTEGMKHGEAALLPREFCRHPKGAPPLEPDRLRTVWLEEGDAVALLEDDELLAVIPAWSGQGGFHGYARDCEGSSPLAWELGPAPDNAMHERVRSAERAWDAWDEKPSPWPALQERAIAAVEAALGPHSAYYAIDGGEWPPTAILRVPVAGGTAFVTLGMCQRPQPTVEMAHEDPAPYRRIELGICVSTDVGTDAEQKAAGYVAAQARLPWARHTWLGEGHTIPCSALGDEVGAVLLRAQPPGAQPLALPDYRGDPVTLLWMLPITTAERDLAVSEGSEALAHRLGAEGRGWMYSPPPLGWRSPFGH